ncbi:peptidyl-prolyl cis-trans isomerase [bacterium]|nr:peptidyl-prolyl cis-trans isomerase [candidate division CSSED10-310 bacterium]
MSSRDRRIIILITVVLLIAWLVAHLAQAAWLATRNRHLDGLVAMVGDHPITAVRFDEEARKSYDSLVHLDSTVKKINFMVHLLDRLVEREIYLAKADELDLHGWSDGRNDFSDLVTELRGEEQEISVLVESQEDRAAWRRSLNEDARIMAVMEVLLPREIVVSDDQVKDIYEAHMDKFITPEQFSLRRILVHNLEQAKVVKDKIERHRTRFEKLAETYSLSEDAPSGGAIGLWSLAMLPNAVAQELRMLKVGQVSPIIKVPEGYAIYKIEKILPAQRIPLDDVRDRIRAEVQEATREGLLNEWLVMEKKRYYIVVNYGPLFAFNCEVKSES